MNEADFEAIEAQASRESWTPSERRQVYLGHLAPDQVLNRRRVNAGAGAMAGLPREKWPDFSPLWDPNPEHRHYSADGVSLTEFDKVHGEVKLIAAPLGELQARFCSASRRTSDEIWTVGHKDRAARILFLWANDKARITPAFISYFGEADCLHIVGGNHRLAVADAAGVSMVPIYVRSEEAHQILSMMPSATVVPDAALTDLSAWDSLFA